MAVVTTAHQKQIESAIAAGKPETAFKVLEGYADLRHADMPPLSKAALAAIAKNPDAVRRFVLGAASTSISVRRFCRKYLPKVGAPAASPLLALAGDALDPFRPGDGLLGSFGGVMSPLARTILDNKMSFELKSDLHAYSDAGRYGKDVMDDVVFLVGATSYDHLIRFCEYQWATGRIMGMESKEKRDFPHADFMPAWTQQTVHETLFKNKERWGETVVRWTSGSTMLLDQLTDDPVATELARRVREHGADAKSQLLEQMVVQYGRNFHGLGQEHRMALYRNLVALLPTWGPKLGPYFSRTLDEYRQKYPDEAAQAASAAPVVTTAAVAVATSEVATPAGSPTPAPSPASATDDSAGPNGQQALLLMRRLAFELRMPKLHDALNRSLEEDYSAEKSPEPGGSAEDEAVMSAVHQTIVAHRTDRPGSTKRRFGDVTYVPDTVLESAPWASDLAALLTRMIETHNAFILAGAAATLLSREALDTFVRAWMERPKKLGPLYDDQVNGVLDPLAERHIVSVPLLRAIFTLKDWEFPVELTECWQRGLAALYLRGGEPGREVTLELLARYPYPKETNEYNNRRDFYGPHLSTMWAAWERHDVEMLALAFERFAMPYFWKSSKAMLPKREPFFVRTGYAAQSDTGEGVGLADVWALAVTGGRVQATLAAALKHAELCEAARTILEMASPELFDGLGNEVLPLLESSNPAVLETGLSIVSRNPACMKAPAVEAVTLAARALTSTRSGTAKEAAVALAALGNAHASVRAQAYAALAEGLALEAAPVLQAILKSMKTLPGKLPGDARERIVELSQIDPAKFEKLAKPLLAA